MARPTHHPQAFQISEQQKIKVIKPLRSFTKGCPDRMHDLWADTQDRFVQYYRGFGTEGQVVTLLRRCLLCAARDQGLIRHWEPKKPVDDSCVVGADQEDREREKARYYQHVGLDDVAELAAPETHRDSRLIDLDAAVARGWVASKVVRALDMIQEGWTQQEAAAEAGMTPVQLSRALADLGRRLTGRPIQRYSRPAEDDRGQMGLFAGVEEAP